MYTCVYALNGVMLLETIHSLVCCPRDKRIGVESYSMYDGEDTISLLASELLVQVNLQI